MTPLRAIAALAIALPMLARSADAQYGGMHGPLDGEWLLGLDMAYTHEEQGSIESESAIVGASLSYFTSRARQLGIELRTRYSALEAGGHAGEVFLGPLYNFNWYPLERTALYAGARAGVAYEDVTGSFDGAEFAWGAQVGLRQWLTPQAAIVLEPRYTRYESDEGGATERDRFDLLIGLNLVL